MSSRWAKYLQLLVAGVIGALVALSVVRIGEKRRLHQVRDRDWNKLNLILDMVEYNYVDTLSRPEMTDAAVTAALATLDPHSLYLPPRQLSDSQEQLAGNFDGIGIQFNVPNDTAVVLEVIPGGPAEKAGMLVGDRMLKVDSVVIAGVKFPQDSMVRHIKGPAGTKVVVTVGRGREVIPFEMTRGKIPLHSVDAAFMLSDSVGYIRLSKFSRTTFKECRDAASALKEEGMSRLVMDLRDNSGGYLDQALLLCNDYLAKGDTIVYMEGLHRKREVFRADGRGLFQDMGLSVLISENSASASEIFSGAIQDNDRGEVIGRRSFGKGLVQEEFDMSDGSGIRLTVARYYTPSGRCIQKPYGSKDYGYDIYKRYLGGEVFSADSIKLDRSDVHYTRSGRPVYGGGGIMPDVFVPLDTTRASDFYIECNRKAVQMRYASRVFDRYGATLRSIDSYPRMDAFLKKLNVKVDFPAYAREVEGIRCTEAEWDVTAPYLVPQLYALVARYSKLGENAFYKYYLPVDSTLQEALHRLND